MSFEIVAAESIASGNENEDRIGAATPLAWVIDGATDVLDHPLTAGGTDAAWFAGSLHAWLQANAATYDACLSRLPDTLAHEQARAFATAASRAPRERFEHPSASGIVLRANGHGLEYVSVGDCTLLVETPDGLLRVGAPEKDAGDTQLGAAIAAYQRTAAAPTAAAARAHVWPRIRAARARMNTDAGHGVFSITAPPAQLVAHGRIDAARGTRALLASDGLMRLSDVYRRFTRAELFDRAWRYGLGDLMRELRAIEAADAEALAHPRAKVNDDASAMLLRLA